MELLHDIAGYFSCLRADGHPEESDAFPSKRLTLHGEKEAPRIDNLSLGTGILKVIFFNGQKRLLMVQFKIKAKL